MKTFKIIDVWISIVLIAGFGIAALKMQSMETLLIGYFAVGGWQILSMLVHYLNHWFMRKGGKRSMYHWVVLFTVTITIILALLSFQLILVPLYLLLFAAPIMAMYYTAICYEEVSIKMKRPLADLKL